MLLSSADGPVYIVLVEGERLLEEVRVWEETAVKRREWRKGEKGGRKKLVEEVEIRKNKEKEK